MYAMMCFMSVTIVLMYQCASRVLKERHCVSYCKCYLLRRDMLRVNVAARITVG